MEGGRGKLFSFFFITLFKKMFYLVIFFSFTLMGRVKCIKINLKINMIVEIENVPKNNERHPFVFLAVMSSSLSSKDK